jgi:pimeloyl-ACP methyl ester carboxylesterase
MAPAIRDARLEVIEGAGHLSNLESPQRVNELLREQLTLLS